MEIHFKITTWERIKIPEGYESKVKELLEKGYITCGDDIYEWFSDNDENAYNSLVCETVLDCNEQMTLEENDGESTIEVYENGELFYENAKK